MILKPYLLCICVVCLFTPIPIISCCMIIIIESLELNKKIR